MQSSILKPSDTEGPLADLNEKLAGPNGALWLMNLKRFLRKEIPWIANDPRNNIINTLPPVAAYNRLCAFVLTDVASLAHGPCTSAKLVESAATRHLLPIPIESTVQQLIIDEFTRNWEMHGLEKVTFLFENGGGQTYDKGTQWTHLHDSFFINAEAGPRKFEPTDKFIFLVLLSQPDPKGE